MNALEFHTVSFGYRGVPLLRNVQWAVPAGTVSGIIGPNGAGKTTLFKLACGLLAPDTGSVDVEGLPLERMNARDAARRVALVPQMEQMVFPYTVRTMVQFGRFPHQAGPGYFSEQDLETVDWAMDLCGITALAGRSVSELSGGELHRVLFARALAQDTPVLLLDEPTAFMDIKYQVTLFDLLLHMRDEYGKTIVCVTHDLNIASTYFDAVSVLCDGHIVDSGTPPEVLTEQKLRKYFDIEVAVHAVEGEAPVIRLLSGQAAQHGSRRNARPVPGGVQEGRRL